MPAQAPETSPDDLGDPGRALWHDVLDKYSLNAGELAILHRAGRTLDLLRRVDEELAQGRLATENLQGTLVANPLIKQSVELSRTFDLLIRSLALPLPDEQLGKVRHPAAQAAAKVRWDNTRK